jgi:opacity protein-like surface antigen
MKKTLLIAAMLLVFGVTQAQIHVGATIGPQFPLGDFGDAAKAGFGLNVAGKYMLNENMAVGLNLGYTRFGTGVEDFSYSMIPVTGLFEYHFGTGNIKPYAGADLGLYSFGVKFKIGDESSSDSKMYFGFAPTVGALYGLSDKLSLCANLKFNCVLSEGDASTWLGLNVGAIIKIK